MTTEAMRLGGGGHDTEAEALWAAGLQVVRKLRDRGFAAYLVGGCVRDRLLGRPLHDIDISTSALPEQVMSCFVRTVPTGLKHGTVTVLESGRVFEVTTYRTESGYSDARRPDEVRFVTDLREDLSRRDFTINALAFGLDEELVDPFGGRNDLAAGIVRCVGDAGDRFGEDALRMLRAIRFAAEFGFIMTLSVWRGIREQAGRLQLVAMERIGAEWDKMMAGNDPDRACGLLLRSGLLNCLKEPLPDRVSGRLCLSRPAFGGVDLRRLHAIPDTDARWAAFLASAGASPEEAGALCRSLRFSRKRETRIVGAAGFHKRVVTASCERSAFVTAVLDFGRGAALDWLQMIAEGELFRDWLAVMTVDSVGQLAVKGDALVSHIGKRAGPWVASLLRQLLEEVAQGNVANERDALLRAASRIEETR